MLLDPRVRAYMSKQNPGDQDSGGPVSTDPTGHPPVPKTPPGGDKGGGDSVGAFDFTTPAYGGPMSPSMAFWRDAPAFNGPQFSAPDAVTMMNDPGYQFRLKQGEQALQQSAAGQGMLRTGGTLKDILGYGQDLASQEYQNVYNRALQTWGAQETGAKDRYAPQFASWQTQMGFGQQDALAAFQRAWDAYAFPISNTTENARIAASIQPPA